MTHIDEFLRRLTVLYGPPETPDVGAFLDEYRKILGAYAPDIIAKGGDYIRDSHTRRAWPTIAEMRAAFREVAPREVVDWDKIEEERRQGWKFSDLAKSVTPEMKARVQKMADDFRRNVAENTLPPDPAGPNWRRGQKDGFFEKRADSPNQYLRRKRQPI